MRLRLCPQVGPAGRVTEWLRRSTLLPLPANSVPDLRNNDRFGAVGLLPLHTRYRQRHEKAAADLWLAACWLRNRRSAAPVADGHG